MMNWLKNVKVVQIADTNGLVKKRWGQKYWKYWKGNSWLS